VDHQDWENSVISFLRFGRTTRDIILVICNFTPVTRAGYALGVPRGGYWRELLNSDAAEYAGSGVGNLGGAEAQREPRHGREWSLRVTLPPLATIWLKSSGD
jgi:1,4-alpha-glucan branching enzyme